VLYVLEATRGQPHGAVRLQGDRDPACQGMRTNHAGRHNLRAPQGRNAGGLRRRRPRAHDAPIAVKEAVLPFHRFRGADGTAIDSLLGPEMKSPRVMASTATSAALSPRARPPPTDRCRRGTVFVSVANRTSVTVFPVKRLADLGFRVLATEAPRRCCAATEFRVTRSASISNHRSRSPEMSAVDAIKAALSTW